MAEGVANHVNVSIEALTQVIEQYNPGSIVYANEETIDGIRKVFLLTREESQYDYVKGVYDFKIFTWSDEGSSFVRTSTAWCCVLDNINIPNANELVESVHFGASFFDFVISSDSEHLRVVYSGYKQLMEVDPADYGY